MTYRMLLANVFSRMIHRLGWLLVAAAALSAQPGLAEKWRFVFFGDTQAEDWTPMINTNIFAELSRAVVREQASFLLFGGDMANHPQPIVPPAWTNIAAPLYEVEIPIFPTIGNHDEWATAEIVQATGQMLPDNGPPGEIDQTYAVAVSNALIVVLNCFVPGREYSINQPWLDDVLRTNTLPHVFVMSHAPAFPVYHNTNACLALYPDKRDAFWRSLVRAGVRVYFSGHDHFYDHCRVDDGDGNPDNDVHQVVAGTGGAALYPDDFWYAYRGTNGIGNDGPWMPTRIMHERTNGYVVVEIEDEKATLTWKRRTGPDTFEANDAFTYTARPPRPRLEFSYRPQENNLPPPGKLTLNWPPGGVLQAAPEPGGPYTNVVGAVPPFELTGPGPDKLFFRVMR